MNHRRWCGGCGTLITFAPVLRAGLPRIVSCKCRNVPRVSKQKGYKIRRNHAAISRQQGKSTTAPEAGSKARRAGAAPKRQAPGHEPGADSSTSVAAG